MTLVRNLSGMWKMMFPHVYSHYFDVPQNYRDDIGGNFYVNEMAELRRDLGELRGKPITDDELRHSIAVYNENRRLVRDLYTFRAERPWQAPATASGRLSTNRSPINSRPLTSQFECGMGCEGTP